MRLQGTDSASKVAERKKRIRASIVLQKAGNWNQGPTWILGSRTRLYGEPVFKFCYQPTTRKLWLGHGRTQDHKTILNVKSGITLDKVVRGIYFPDIRTIYLRDHERQDWLEQTKAMLEANGLPKGYRVIWGPAAASKLRSRLEGL